METWSQGGVDYQLTYVYDANGAPKMLRYRTSDYTDSRKYDDFYLQTNPQGDIVAIYNADGEKICTYTYDAWGNCRVELESGITTLESSIANTLNPFRYRGYYLDVETGLYYLQTRYYNPSWGRFINADGVAYLGAGDELLGYNLFSYCGNNPVMGYDPMGTLDWSKLFEAIDLILIGATAISLATAVLLCSSTPPGMMAIAAVTAGAGALTTVNGVAEVGESISGYNFVRDGAFGGNQEVYDAYRGVTKGTAEVGSTILGLYIAANGGNVCFVAGTLIAAEIGQVAIEEIEEGDLVWATDPETGETELKEVVQLFRNETTELVHLTIGEETITTTPTHPFYVPNKGWISAINLRAGDILVQLNGEYIVVEQVQHEILEAPVTVYNFEVDGFHTYYVGDTNVLVHNLCSGNPQSELSDDALRQIGRKGDNSGFRVLNGSHKDAMNFVKSQTNGLTEYAPGKFVGYNSRGVGFRIYAQPMKNYTSIRVQGIAGLKGFKFLW